SPTQSTGRRAGFDREAWITPVSIRRRARNAGRDASPGIEAVVVVLTHDPAVAKLHEDRKPRPQDLPGDERPGAVADRARPHHLERDLIAAGDRVERLERLSLQQRQAAHPTLLHVPQPARRAVAPQSVPELLL